MIHRFPLPFFRGEPRLATYFAIRPSRRQTACRDRDGLVAHGQGTDARYLRLARRGGGRRKTGSREAHHWGPTRRLSNDVTHVVVQAPPRTMIDCVPRSQSNRVIPSLDQDNSRLRVRHWRDSSRPRAANAAGFSGRITATISPQRHSGPCGRSADRGRRHRRRSCVGERHTHLGILAGATG